MNSGDPRRGILQGIRRKIDVREARLRLFEVREGKLDLSFDHEKAERRENNLKSKHKWKSNLNIKQLAILSLEEIRSKDPIK